MEPFRLFWHCQISTPLPTSPLRLYSSIQQRAFLWSFCRNDQHTSMEHPVLIYWKMYPTPLAQDAMHIYIVKTPSNYIVSVNTLMTIHLCQVY